MIARKNGPMCSKGSRGSNPQLEQLPGKGAAYFVLAWGAEVTMSPIMIGLIVFACVFGGVLLGMVLRRILPDHHLSGESREAVKLGVGLIGTMAALLLGLLVASAKSSYDSQSNELTEMAAKVMLLDRILIRYGPEETKALRDDLRVEVAETINHTWTAGGPGSSRIEKGTAGGGERLWEQLQALSPKNDSQRALKSQAGSIALDLGHTRWLLAEQGTSGMPTAFLVVVVLWLTVMYASFGLLAPKNTTVLVTLLLCAVSVSAAIFLILELYRPFQGVIQISSAPLRYALAQLGQ